MLTESSRVKILVEIEIDSSCYELSDDSLYLEYP